MSNRPTAREATHGDEPGHRHTWDTAPDLAAAGAS